MSSKKTLWIVLPLLTLLVLGLWTYGRVQQLEQGAKDLASFGTDAIQLLKEAAKGIETGDLDRLMATYADDYLHQQQGVWTETLRSERDGIRVYDWQPGAASVGDKDAMASRLQQLMEPIASLELAKFKLASVEEMQNDDRLVVRSILWLRGVRQRAAETESGPDTEAFETQATFRMHLHRQDGAWKIVRQSLLHGQTVSGQRQGFVDVARTVGVDFRAQQNPLFSTPEWEPSTFEIIKYGSAGVSAADVDGDGWYDLFFGDGRSPRLFHNQGSGPDGRVTFVDITAAAGLPTEAPSGNVGLFADLDNDGDKDLMLGRFVTGSQLFRNDGPGEDGIVRFTEVTADANLGRGFVVVAGAADYDNDGDLDLYLGRYLDPRKNLPTTLFYTRNGEGNSLLRNDGNLTFTDVTEDAGVAEGGLTLGVAWADYDEDGDSDLYVANDFGRNALLRNEGPDATGTVRFVDVSAETGSLDFGFGMSASWGDVDNDADLDLYVSNVHSGQRWYGQAATLYQYLLTSLKQGTITEDFPLYKEIYGYAGADWRHYGDGMVKGNSLLLNDGGKFHDVAETAGANPFGWYWGSAFFDYDNDGRKDIYAANGWISGRSYDDL